MVKTFAVFLAIVASAACTAPAPQPQPQQREPEPDLATDARRPLTVRTTEPTLRERAVFEAPILDTSEETLRAIAPSPEKLARLTQARHHAWSRPSNAAQLLTPILNARYDRTLGSRLDELLADLPPERAAYGVDALTYNQVWISEEFCEGPKIDFEVTHDGETYQARYALERWLAYTTPQPLLYALSSTCAASLAAHRTAVDRAIGDGCTLEDESAHFQVGTPCRRCLQEDGDLERCIGVDRCKREMTRELGIVVDGQTRYYDVLEAAALACAPDHFSQITVLAEELGPENIAPDPFTHGPIAGICEWHWSLADERPAMVCTQKVGNIEPALADLLGGRVEYIRLPGEERPIYGGRFWLASGMELEGVEFDTFPLMPGTIAELSEPELSEGGWNYNPRDLRADGTDPLNIDHTKAREWISAITLKTATLIRGVFIVTFNQNLCAEEDWKGPDEEGRYFCKNPGYDLENPAPAEDQWSYDWGSYAYPDDPNKILTFPWVTLASTGHTDPKIPGGHVVEVLGSPTLADPEWDNCSYGSTFTPDEMGNWDSAQNSGLYTYSSQTYRFGKNPQQDIRVVLGANWRRGFCFEAP